MSDFNPYQRPDAEVVSHDVAELEVHAGVRRPVGHAVQWVGDGWAIFARNWGVWCVALFLNVLISSAAGLLPFVGFILQMLLSTVLTAGLLYMASQGDKGEPVKVADLFRGFQEGTGSLMLFGLLFLLMTIVVVAATVVVSIPFFASDFSSLQQAFQGDSLPAAPGPEMVFKVLLVACIFLLLFIPVIAGYWFGLPLVFFGEVGIWAAFRHSFVVCMRNFLSLFVYGLLMMAVFIGAFLIMSIIVGLANVLGPVGMFVMIPVMVIFMFALSAWWMASWYASFRDIFVSPE